MPQIVRIVHAAYRGSGGWTTEEHLVAGARIDEDETTQLVDDPDVIIIVAEREMTIVGCAALFRDGEEMEFGLFAVDPAAQTGGIGHALLEEQVRRARALGVHALTIRVLQGRPELNAWYERRGFRPTGQVRDFPADPSLLRVEGLRMVEMRRDL